VEEVGKASRGKSLSFSNPLFIFSGQASSKEGR
jgi:hypothetical protein